MSETLSTDYDAWEDHARWWHGEADQAQAVVEPPAAHAFHRLLIWRDMTSTMVIATTKSTIEIAAPLG